MGGIMRKYIYTFCIAIMVSLLFAQSVPRVMNYQGKLFYSDGPAQGSYYFQYDLDDDTLSEPDYRWRQEPATDVDSIVVDFGLFSDTLGLWIDTTLAAYSVLYLRVSVKKNYLDSWTYLGSERLLSAPYALVAAGGSGGENLAQTLEVGNFAGGYYIDMENRSIQNVATPTTADSTIGSAVSTGFLNGVPISVSTSFKLYHD